MIDIGRETDKDRHVFDRSGSSGSCLWKRPLSQKSKICIPRSNFRVSNGGRPGGGIYWAGIK